ncbi:LysM peptidoglycan-binding domain-containing protein [Paenibacillus pasadenensis]|uniref:LysM peptidoglycan-binding domain-containing protein n=1 Tax=Paenibacillus pasadenensis TaxID=217090 RepID=UPI00203E9475|nr:LysM peptidoglycan-binding domain-containing protein [Paenibacillus pasadenensis]
MSGQSQGLRFDVYERVHLPEEVAAIEELEEIELVPRIQVIQQGEQAILRGQLQLSGVYRTADRADNVQTMEHGIPVEITLPMNRIESLEDISVEIDNFDVDLLSSRTLNITGVLSLTGFRVEPAAEEQAGWQEEPFTAVHRPEAQPQPTGDISSFRYLELEQEEEEQPQQAAYAGTEAAYPNVSGSEDEEETAAEQDYRPASSSEYEDNVDPMEAALNEPYQYAAGWTQLGTPRAQDDFPAGPPTYLAPLQSADAQQYQQPSFDQWPGLPRQDEQPPEPEYQRQQTDQPDWIALQRQEEEEEQDEFTQQEEAEPAAEFEQQRQSFEQPPDNQPEAYSEKPVSWASFSAYSSLSSSASSSNAGQEEAEPAAVLYGRPQGTQEPEPAAEAAEPASEEPAANDRPSADEPAASGAREASAEAAANATGSADQPESSGQSAYASAFAAEQPQEPERQELRIAVGAKRSPAPPQQEAGDGITSLIGRSRREQEQRQAAERNRQQQQEASAAVPAEEVEWQSLFLSRASDESAFRKVKMCIVQREETLELIADRYQLQAREIALHNRLADGSVSEGQVLYIP